MSMSYYQKRIDEGPVLDDYCVSDDQMLGNLCRDASRPMSPKGQLEQEKRMRREIANSNERRRMQSINAGFNSLKTLLPHPDGEKLSKAAILQQTADYISSLEKDRNHLLSQNSQLKLLLGDLDDTDYGQVSPPPKRKKRDTESSDEGINMAPALDDPTPMDLKREMIDIRGQLDRERCLRMMLEDQIRKILTEAQMCPDKLRHIAQQMRHQVLRQKFLEEERRKQEIHEVKVAVKEELKSPLPDLKSPLPDIKSPLHEVNHIETAPKVCPVTTPPVPRNKAFLNSYMSRRNLDMIVEAIRHLEGEQALLDEPSRDNHPNSEDSEKDSHSSVTLSDHEDCFSGRDSPLQPQIQATVHMQHNAHVLLGDPTLLPHRPGVIVQTTSS